MLLVFQPWGYMLGEAGGFTTSGELVTSLGA